MFLSTELISAQSEQIFDNRRFRVDSTSSFRCSRCTNVSSAQSEQITKLIISDPASTFKTPMFLIMDVKFNSYYIVAVPAAKNIGFELPLATGHSRQSSWLDTALELQGSLVRIPPDIFSQDSGKYRVYSANTHRCMGKNQN